jgi:hypothetical protein
MRKHILFVSPLGETRLTKQKIVFLRTFVPHKDKKVKLKVTDQSFLGEGVWGRGVFFKKRPSPTKNYPNKE